jgi:nucleoside-diphosphate-sugar epimerase
MKKILVTGATGFIGNYLVPQLLELGHTVIATSASQEKAAGRTWFPNVEYIPFRLEDFSPGINYFDFFKQPDIIIHLAWEGLPNYKSLFHFETNLPRHYAFLKNLVVNGASDITITGTCFEYGMKEGCLREDMVTDPANAYALAKDCLRKFLQQFQSVHPFALKWVRLFYMYGAGQNPKSIFSQLETAIRKGEKTFNMSGGDQVRDFLHVQEAASNIRSISTQKNLNGIINCCSGNPVKLADLVRNYLNKVNSNISLNLGFYPYNDYEPMEFWGDNSKLQTILKNERST